MAVFANGTGGTLQGITSVEDYFAGAINYLLSQQMNLTKNPTNLQYLTRTINAGGLMSGQLSVPCTISSGAGGALSYAAPSYLTAVTWMAQTGGDAPGITNEVQAVIDAARRLKVLELDSTKNTTNANYISLTTSMGSTSTSGTNGTITIAFSSFPLDLTVAANGDATYSGKPYLA